MKTNSIRPIRTAISTVAFSFLVASGMMFAQDQPAGPPPPPPDQPAERPRQWRMAQGRRSAAWSEPPRRRRPPTQPLPAEAAPRATMDPNYSAGSPQDANPQYPNPQYPNAAVSECAGRSSSIQTNIRHSIRASNIRISIPTSNIRTNIHARGPNPYPPAATYNRGPIPAKLTIKPGTFITVRLNQGLSSDRNQTGDAFAATLAKPVMVDGVVVAERGQTVGGKVDRSQEGGPRGRRFAFGGAIDGSDADGWAAGSDSNATL